MTKAEALEKKLIKDHEKALKVQEKQAREQLKKQKDQEKESKRLERLRKKAAIEQKKIARAFKAEQVVIRKTRLFDDVSIKTIKGTATTVKRQLPNGAMWMGKECVMFLLTHPDNPDVALLRVDDPVKTSWRNGYWFYDFDNKIQMKFEKSIHKPEHGNASIRWEMFDKYVEEKMKKEEA
jgi:hypothetical protein